MMMMIVIKITFNSPLNVGIESLTVTLSAQLHDSLFFCPQVSIATERFAKKWPGLDVCPKRYSFLILKVCIAAIRKKDKQKNVNFNFFFKR